MQIKGGTPDDHLTYRMSRVGDGARYRALIAVQVNRLDVEYLCAPDMSLLVQHVTRPRLTTVAPL